MAQVRTPRRTTAKEFGQGIARWVLESVALIVVLVALWQVLTSVFHPLYFPTPVAIWGQIARAWFTPLGFTADILPSFERVTLGWLLAAVIGVPLGVAVGRSRSFAEYVTPLVHYARAVPPPVILPIFMIFFGVGNAMKVVFIAVGVLWPILLNVIKGVESVETVQLDTATVYGIGGSRRLLHVVLPAAMPDILAGLRISLALAFVLMVISEMIAASGGIGYQILQSQAQFDILNMWAGIVVLAVGGVVFNAVLTTIEGRVLRWHRGQRREAL
ncbi:MAG: ABC transporter permease [Thermaerobacter sp.]|nr:ABC transporter permease [Thermaerobacter sp.]